MQKNLQHIQILALISILLVTGCTGYLTPEETVDKNIEASIKGDAETRWELSSKSAKEELLKNKSEEEVLANFRKEVFMYKFIRSWKTETVNVSESKATLKLHYKFFDPHSKKVQDMTDEIALVKEDGFWRIED